MDSKIRNVYTFNIKKDDLDVCDISEITVFDKEVFETDDIYSITDTMIKDKEYYMKYRFKEGSYFSINKLMSSIESGILDSSIRKNSIIKTYSSSGIFVLYEEDGIKSPFFASGILDLKAYNFTIWVPDYYKEIKL